MLHNFKILTRKSPDHAHAEVGVTIDWSMVTPEQMQMMARGHIVNCIHASFRKQSEALPESIYVLALDFIHDKPYVQSKIPVRREIPDPPKSFKKNKPKKLDIDALLASLSKEELLALLT